MKKSVNRLVPIGRVSRETRTSTIFGNKVEFDNPALVYYG